MCIRDRSLPAAAGDLRAGSAAPLPSFCGYGMHTVSMRSRAPCPDPVRRSSAGSSCSQHERARTCTNVRRSGCRRHEAAAHRAPVPDLLRKCRRECRCGFQGCPLWPVWLCAGKMWPGIVSALCVALCASCALLRSCSRILVRSAARLLLPDLRALDPLRSCAPCPGSECRAFRHRVGLAVWIRCGAAPELCFVLVIAVSAASGYFDTVNI